MILLATGIIIGFVAGVITGRYSSNLTASLRETDEQVKQYEEWKNENT